MYRMITNCGTRYVFIRLLHFSAPRVAFLISFFLTILFPPFDWCWRCSVNFIYWLMILWSMHYIYVMKVMFLFVWEYATLSHLKICACCSADSYCISGVVFPVSPNTIFFFCMHMCSKNPFRKPYAQWGLINCVLMKPVSNRKALEGTDVVLRPFLIAGCNAYDNWLYAAQYVCMCLVLTLLFLNFWNNICENQSFYPVLEKQLMLIMSCNFCFSFIHVLPLFLLPIFPLQFLLILLVGVGVCILFLRKSLNY